MGPFTDEYIEEEIEIHDNMTNTGFVSIQTYIEALREMRELRCALKLIKHGIELVPKLNGREATHSEQTIFKLCNRALGFKEDAKG